MTQLIQIIATGIAVGSLFASVGIGFVVIHRVTGIANFAQGATTLAGAYVMNTLVGVMSWILAALCAAVTVAGISVILGWLALGARKLYVYAGSILTLGAAFIFEGIFTSIWGTVPVSYRPLVNGTIRFQGAFIFVPELVLTLLAIVMLIATQFFFGKTFLGKALSAVAMNGFAARLVGVNLVLAGLAAFAVAGFLGGFVGAAAGATIAVSPSFHVTLAISGFAAAIVGSLDRVSATFAGGICLGLVASATSVMGAPEYQQVAVLSALIVLLIVQRVWHVRGGRLA